MQPLRVHFLPELVKPAELAGGTAIVIDVLRATTTITTALAAGAREVLPLLTVEEARQAAKARPTGSTVLGGERAGGKIAGFDLGNSPSEYTPQSVGGRSLIITTTNGTKALLHARTAGRILLAAFTNLSAVCSAVSDVECIDILCAGTDGQITREDVLLAGAIVERLTAAAQRDLNDQARIARDAWRSATCDVTELAELRRRLAAELRETQGGRNLIGMGLEADLEAAADMDRYSITPIFEASAGAIRISKGP